MEHRIDGLTIVAIALILFMIFNVFQDRGMARAEGEIIITPPADNGIGSAQIIYPYDEFLLTQGPHGASYGHLAIDLSAGEGSAIKSPIEGVVTQLYVDEYGNPTLVLENDIYQVTLLHGNYDVEVGQSVTLGEYIGNESNLGYTTDMNGIPCKNRDCGYHTHLNIYDKRLSVNVNPLEVLQD